MATTYLIRGIRGIVNEYRLITPEYTLLRISSPSYDDITTIVDTRLIQELMKFSWSKHYSPARKGSYISGSINDDRHRDILDKYPVIEGIKKSLLLHRLIACLAELPQPEGHDTIDHISRNSFDNRVVNLRWATRAQQSFNRDKYTFKLEPITDEIPRPLPKYMNFCNEKYGKEVNGKERMRRTFFRIERHPALRIPWATTKSNAVSDIEKYRAAITKLNELNEAALADPEENLRAQLELEFNTLIETSRALAV